MAGKGKLVVYAVVALFCLVQLAFLRAATQSAGCAKGFEDTAAAHSVVDEAADALQRLRWEIWPYKSGVRSRSTGEAAGTHITGTRVGIVTGGSSDLYGGSKEAYGDVTTCLLRRMVQRWGYAFYAERALQRFGADRPVAWQKIRLLAERLSDVDLLIWVDADVAWTAPDTDLADLFLSRLTTPVTCTGHLGQPKWESIAGAATRNAMEGDILFWASADVRPKQQRNMNLNSAVIALRSCPEAQAFLAAVWSDGNDLYSFTKYNPGWRRQPVGQHYWGWPFEQGSVWGILQRDPGLFRRTCVVDVGTLHSVEYSRWVPGGSLGAHMPGMSNEDRRKAACHHLSTDMQQQLGSCAKTLSECPDLFVGRLLAPHAEGLCAHCLEAEAGAGSKAGAAAGQAAGAGNVTETDWSMFDCSCLRGKEGL